MEQCISGLLSPSVDTNSFVYFSFAPLQAKKKKKNENKLNGLSLMSTQKKLKKIKNKLNGLRLGKQVSRHDKVSQIISC